MEITIGLQFINKNRKSKEVSTVVDILKTYNSKDELVKTEYLTEHLFCGQKIQTILPKSTITMSVLKDIDLIRA